MVHIPARDQPVGGDRYRRHRPEDTLLYQLVERFYPEFVEHMRRQGRALPTFVQREFDEFLKCGRLEYGFLRVRCSDCHAEKLVAFSCKGRGFCPSCGARRMVDAAALLVDEVLPSQPIRQWVLSVPFALRFLFTREPAALSAALGIVIRAIGSHLIGRAGLTRAQAQTGAVTFIQRFGGALNLNIHFHMLVLDGVYVRRLGGIRFVPVAAPTSSELQRLVERISDRVGRHLERRGLLIRDADHAYLDWDDDEASVLDELAGHAITYRVAIGPHQGQKAFTLQTLPAIAADDGPGELAAAGGFSLHAGIAAKADQREKLERLCRYVARSAVADSRLSLTRDGRVRYSLKTPWRDGTTHVVFEPLDFIARLAALIPRPGINLTRYHGIFAPNSRLRAQVTPARRGKRPTGACAATEPEKRRAMTWARRLKRVFKIEIDQCEHCGGAVKIIACIQRPEVIQQILRHVRGKGQARRRPQAPRAPPDSLLPSLFDSSD